MFLHNNKKYSLFTIRHSWTDILQTWTSKDIPDIIKDTTNNLYEGVKQYPMQKYNGRWHVLIELRTFYPQLQKLLGVKGLTLRNMHDTLRRMSIRDVTISDIGEQHLDMPMSGVEFIPSSQSYDESILDLP